MDTEQQIWMVVYLLIALSRFAPAFAGQGNRDLCQQNSDCNSGYCFLQAPNCATEFCGSSYCVGNSPTITIQTQGNFFLTAENGGGLSGTDAAMNTNRTQQLGL